MPIQMNPPPYERQMHPGKPQPQQYVGQPGQYMGGMPQQQGYPRQMAPGQQGNVNTSAANMQMMQQQAGGQVGFHFKTPFEIIECHFLN